MNIMAKNYAIENDKIKIEVTDVGAELASLVLKADGTEYLWQRDATYWASSASNLFPICGRLTEGKYTYQGNTYEMILHGFARHKEMQVIAQTENTLVFELKADAESLAQYPFAFVLQIGYELSGNTVTQTFTVKNEDDKVMYFAVGGHPGFNVPLTEGETFEDYYVEFDCVKPAKKLVMSPTCYFTGELVDFPMEDGKRIPLKHSLFDNDAIFLADMCKGVTLKSHKCDKEVHLAYPQMQYLGFWHKPKTEAPYICIEPWYSTPAFDCKIDDLETKNQMIALPSGETYTNSFTISIK